MDKELKVVFRNSLITVLIMFIYGLIIGQKSIYIAFSLGAMLSLLNLYLIFKDAEILIHVGKNALRKKNLVI